MSGPVSSGRESRVLGALLKRALRGEPVHPRAVGVTTGFPPQEVEDAVAALEAAGALYQRDGRLVALYPLSLVPTRHRVLVGSATVFANCAVDALAVPLLVEDPVTVESSCALCGAPVSVRMRGDEIVEAQPEAVVVYVVAEEGGEPGPPVLTRCPHINFFCAPAHATAWQGSHPDRPGRVLTVAEAARRAQERFAPVARAVRGDVLSVTELGRPGGPRAGGA